MNFSEKENLANDGGVILNQHPPVIASLNIKKGLGKLKAGTLMKKGTTGLEAAAPADTPDVVLVEDVNAVAGEEIVGRCLIHGCVAAGRLLDRSGGEGHEAAAAETLYEKLTAKGIYPMQSFD